MRLFSLAALASLTATLFAAPIKVDLNSDASRQDVRTPNWENWAVKNTSSDSVSIGALTCTLTVSANGKELLAPNWWKRGYDSGATLASDGVVVNNSSKQASLNLKLHGLTPGQHSLTTYHNLLNESPRLTYQLSINGKPTASVAPSVRATNDFDAASAFLSFEVKAGEDVVISFQLAPDSPPGPLVLNGFELDGLDPARRISHPSPAADDEHVAENPILSWQPAPAAFAYQLYLGTDAAAVTAATSSSPEFIGTLAVTQFKTAHLDSNAPYFWRVDVVDQEKTITRGETRKFRIRHLAFPEAEGYGRFAIGGRGGRVMEVTNLNDSGPGSLRAAVEADGPRTVVFRVGGTITLKDKLIIKNPYLTIAGQTAPGDGICIRGFTLGGYYTHDLILRHLRIRVGDESGKTMDGAGLGGCDHAIVDHCSISWSIDEAFSSRGARNITLQRTLLTEALNMSVHSHYTGTGKGHSFAGSISGKIGSFHHNLIVNCAGRNWSLAGGLTQGGQFGGYLDIRNNVVFNWAHRTNDGGAKAVNLVNNFYIPGPASKVFHLLQPDFGTKEDPQQYFLSGNHMVGYDQYDALNWAKGGVKLPEKSLNDSGLSLSEITAMIYLQQPFAEPFVTTHSAKDAYDSVLADVGANIPRHDSVDTRALTATRTRKLVTKGSKTGLPGIIDSQKDVGGWPVLKNGPAPTDSDHDGLPDDWETAHQLNPADPTDSAHFRPDGYTHLENYLNQLRPLPSAP